MKTYNFTTPTRQALRNLVKLMKREGLKPTSNETTRTKNQPWQCKLNVEGDKTNKKKHFKVVNGIAVAA